MHEERRHRRRRGGASRLGLRDLLAAGHGRLLAAGFVVLCVIAGSGAGWLLSAGPSGEDAPAPENPAGVVAPASASPDASTDPGSSPLPAADGPTGSAAPSSQPVGPDGETVATRVRIDRLGIDLRIIEGDGIDAPLGKAAHHPDSAWPGGGSNVYVYAHAQDGMFLPLWQAKVGDEVVVRLADTREVGYHVTKVLPKVAWNAVEYLAPTDHEQLTLQTCTSYGAAAPRFIVIAEPDW